MFLDLLYNNLIMINYTYIFLYSRYFNLLIIVA